MNSYIIYFSKTGYIKYTSHLDMLRLFKRAFRRSGIELKYSCGFNPHPKMSFGQPLSLGYESTAEMLEFETDKTYSRDYLIDQLESSTPAGIKITDIGEITAESRTVAASIESAEYSITFPVSYYSKDSEKIVADYLDQKEIITEKKQKKTKQLVETDIRSKIRSISANINDENRLVLNMLLDSGSKSNLSPELVIKTFMEFSGIKCNRYDVEVTRNKLNLPVDFPIQRL